MNSVFIISAPSGSGKSTLVARLLNEMTGLAFSVSFTTRKARGKEKNGEDYVFINREDFLDRIQAGEFLEHADVFGNYYGTHISSLTGARLAGKDLVLDIDVQGAAQLKKRISDAVTIFVLAPSREMLEHRLRARSQDSEEVIQRRLADAVREIRNYNLYDYVVVNDDLDVATETLKSIVRAERVRRVRVEDKIRPILATFSDRGSDELKQAEEKVHYVDNAPQ